MKNRKIKILFLISIIILSGCSKDLKYSNGFFAWMDAYIAVEKGEGNVIALTYFYKEEPFEKDEIAGIEFVNLDKKIITIDDFLIDDLKQTGEESDKASEKTSDKAYSSYSITLKYTPNTVGVYETSGVKITFKSNKTLEYPVGKWTFDINEKSSGYVDAWSSPVASNNGSKFAYDYLSLNSKDIITKIYYGEKSFKANENGLKKDDNINMKKCYAAPIVYIKSKILVSTNEGEKLDFGKGCYCGAFEFSEDVIKSSEEHNSIK